MSKHCLHASWPVRILPKHAASGILLLLLVSLGVAMPAPANAQSCRVNTGPSINFGEVDRSTTDASGTISITCQRNFGEFAAFRVCLNVPGTNPAGAPSQGINPRWMSNDNGAYLAYDLYSDPSRMRLLGPSGGGYPAYSTSFDMFNLLITSRTFTMPVYGRVHPGQRLPASSPLTHVIAGGELRYAYNVPRLFVPFPDPPTESQCLSRTGASGHGLVSFETNVRATVANTCRITAATDLDFGAVTALPNNRDQTSTIQFQCPVGASWQVGLDNGSHAEGDTRRMAGPDGRYLRYELYRDPQRSQRWGNTRNSDMSQGTGTDATQTLTVHGRVPAQPTPVPGNYADTVTITLTY